MDVPLNAPTDIVVQAAQTVNCECLKVQRIVNIPASKQVRVFIAQFNRPVVLWEGDEYRTDMGWTKTDVEDRLKALAVSGFTFAS